eukprot:scaffold86051_cov45-Phaeocystis_antarctica.AAC.1
MQWPWSPGYLKGQFKGSKGKGSVGAKPRGRGAGPRYPRRAEGQEEGAWRRGGRRTRKARRCKAVASEQANRLLQLQTRVPATASTELCNPPAPPAPLEPW